MVVSSDPSIDGDFTLVSSLLFDLTHCSDDSLSVQSAFLKPVPPDCGQLGHASERRLPTENS